MNYLVRPVIATLIALGVAGGGYRKKSLDFSGALAGFFVMAIHFTCGIRYGSMLLAFFLSSSKLTKVGHEKKRLVDPELKDGGQRNWRQVLSNSALATVLVVWISTLEGMKERCMDSKGSTLVTCLIGGVIGHYCCCNGDTWSSEIGVLSHARPRLITTLKPVQRGVNGGVTKVGLLAAVAGGGVIGLTFIVVGGLATSCGGDAGIRQLWVLPLSALSGLCGSIVDSLLGATLQFSGFCSVRKKVVGKPGPTVKRISGHHFLDNNEVNFFSILLTTMLTSALSFYIF